MNVISDDWPKNRIVWNLKKNGMPTGQTFFYSDEGFSLEIHSIAKSGQIGVPIAVCFANRDLWTFLGTKAIMSKNNALVSRVTFDDLQDFSFEDATGFPPVGPEWIHVIDQHGNRLLIWGPPGRECLALSSVLLMVMRMKPRNKEPS
jgi:hypothetical protein